MQKTYTKSRTGRLARELSSLRKGSGLAPQKLQDKQAIREIVAHATHNHSNGLTNHQVYNFLRRALARMPDTLATMALRSAFNIDIKPGNLSIRRQQFAEQSAKHTDTIERYENKAILEFAALLIYEAEINKDTPASSSGGSYASRLDKQTEVIRHTTVTGLETLLSLDNHGAELMTYLERTHRPYLDATVDVKVLPSSRGEEWYRLKLTFVFRGSRETFRLAATQGTDGERLMQTGLIDEYLELSTLSTVHDIRSLINNSKLTLYTSEPGTTAQKLLRFHELSPAENDQLLRSAGITPHHPCRLLEISIPDEWQSPEVTYEYQTTISLRVDERYAYWYAPGLMFTKKIAVDFSEFPQKEKWRFHMQSHLGPVTDYSSPDEYTIIYRPHTWIMPGHGITVTWQKKTTSLDC